MSFGPVAKNKVEEAQRLVLVQPGTPKHEHNERIACLRKVKPAASMQHIDNS